MNKRLPNAPQKKLAENLRKKHQTKSSPAENQDF